jgi:hypothetical protein
VSTRPIGNHPTSFARTYVITARIELFGLTAFLGGIGLAIVTPIGAVLAAVGFILGMIGLVASNVSAYRALRSRGHSSYSAWMRCGPESVPSYRRYKDYQALLRIQRSEG